ncbi:D-alanyl-D-alanine carboxypeptidase/D-alanyl-D-alanine endopeptidase [Lihuaxuella thermophila]|uniref:D-alanyl-D-alanine carboxypeptidase, serine-type, PBP4 family n=1 Tax=Lihuaxuella thermophila TaxID=1173111 RepID=A0A1H8HTF7_9BACL|nr:D-alanyl-D-alanine carboxypeptidase/D-alanyl-D-alanine-endopeptidase [Lihuaxuella thermophila]SEN59403.1 D-alanyl-D-alanine carboxypeptidase, serine-type, PBP4 family [Lihuaxuella thermophila]
MNRWQRRICFALIFFILQAWMAVPAWASGGSDPDVRLDRTLRQYVQELKQNPDTKGMLVGYEVYSLDRHKAVSSWQESKTFVPGSTLKLLVSAALLDRWPRELRIPTELYIDGRVAGGVLRGDVILKGYGDPSLTVDKLDQLAQALVKKGIRKMSGDIVVDDSYYDSVRLGTSWMWDDELFPFSAQIGAVSVNGNTVRVKVTPGRLGKPPRVTVSPAPDYVRVVNRAVTEDGDNQNLTITRTRAKNELVISGKIGTDHPGLTVKRTVVEPGLFAGYVFKERLQKKGMLAGKHTTVITGAVSAQAERIGQIVSPPMDQLLRHMTKKSDNFFAEMLLKQLGAREAGEGSAEAGIRAIQSFARDRAGMNLQFRQVDGSGLSRQDAISPHHLVQLLETMDRHPAGERFWSLLPVAGVDGTLKNRMTGTPGEKHVRAKTGGEFGLAGIAVAQSGERFAFSVLIKGAQKKALAKALQDRIAITLATYPDLPDPGELPPEEAYLLSDAIDPLLADEAYAGMISGIMVQSVDHGEVLYRHHAEALLTPASNIKLFTAGAALRSLGMDYRFKTELYRTGPIRDGVLKGDLVMKGYGDPTLATDGPLRVQEGPVIEQIVSDLKALGIQRVEGNVVADAGIFTDDVYGDGWSWDDESEYYQPQITALSLNRGTVRLDYLPGEKAGDPIRLTLSPKTDYVRVVNEVVTGPAGSENTLKIWRDRGTNTIRLSGSLPLDFGGDYTRVPVENPHLYAGHVLKEQLEQAGISFSARSGVTSGPVPEESELLRRYLSPPLAEVIQYLNKNSDNFYAEMILKTIGFEKKGEGTAKAGISVVTDYSRSLGVDLNADLLDGSGLTRRNQLASAHLVGLLTALTEEPYFSAIYDSLPIAGVDGTLRSRMKNTAAAGNLRGKTGSLTDVSALSGYVSTQDGERLAYSMLMNGYTSGSMRELQDKIGVLLAEFKREQR